MNVADYLKSRRMIVDEALDRYLPKESPAPPVIFRSVRYSVFAGGKRLRPVVCIASAEAVGGDIPTVLPAACALELIHTYSLIHDDLPAMDDDDYRRGNLTNHKAFGEAIAILAGDALLTEAFHLLSGKELQDLPPKRVLRAIHEISKAAGVFGMVGGQVMDIESEGRSVKEETLYFIHEHKTAALITASVRVGAILCGAPEAQLDALTEYGRSIGLAFQIADDILNVEGDRTLLGKDTGTDEARKKATFPALIGIEASRDRAEELVERALEALGIFDDRAEPLRGIARFVMERKV